MLFKKYVYNILEKKRGIKNNPNLTLQPAKSYVAVDRERGTVKVYTNPHRWKKTDIEPKSLKNKLQSIDNNFDRGAFIDDFINKLSESDDDKIKLEYLDYFISKEFFNDFSDELMYIDYDAGINLIPTYRHFLQIFLSLGDEKILKEPKYRDAFKTLLFLDWAQQKYFYSSYLELLMYSALDKVKGKDFQKTFFNPKKFPPLIINNLAVFNESLNIIKEIYNETKELEKSNIEKPKKLYRGIKLDIFSSEKLYDLIQLYKQSDKAFMEEISQLINNFKPKLLESWTSDVIIAGSFSSLSQNSITLEKLQELDENRIKQIIFKLKPKLGILLEMDYDNLSENTFVNHNIFRKYLKRFSKDNDIIQWLSASISINNENEYIILGRKKQIMPTNIKHIGLVSF